MEIKRLHQWEIPVSEAKKLQETLRQKYLIIENRCSDIKTVAGADVSYSRGSDIIYSAVVIMELETMKVLERVYHIDKANFPYVPGYLSFREAPVLMRSFKKLKVIPDAVICDGHGIAHPRGFGLASHVGVLLDLPSVGVAKKKLVGEHKELKENSGSFCDLIYKNKKVGIVFRSREKVKPIYISPGHKVDFDKSLEIVKKTIKKYRLSEPVREAHRFVNEIRRMNS